jgi:hypothetical protein
MRVRNITTTTSTLSVDLEVLTERHEVIEEFQEGANDELYSLYMPVPS